MTTKKGIVDPWRVVDPVKAPVRAARVDLGDIDFDEDLRVPVQHTFRCISGGININSKRIETEEDALRELIGFLFEVLEFHDGPDLFESRGIGFTLGTREWNSPGPKTPSSYLGEGQAVISFHKKTLDVGMRDLISLIGIIRRRPGRAKLLTKWGITPLLR